MTTILDVINILCRIVVEVLNADWFPIAILIGIFVGIYAAWVILLLTGNAQ